MANTVLTEKKDLSLETSLVLAGMSVNKATEFSEYKSEITVKKRVQAELGYLPEKPESRFKAMFLSMISYLADHDDCCSFEAYKALRKALNCDFDKVGTNMRHLIRGAIHKVSPWQLRAIAQLEAAATGAGDHAIYYCCECALPRQWAEDILLGKAPCLKNLEEVDTFSRDWAFNRLEAYSKPFYDPEKGGDAMLAFLKERASDLKPREWQTLELRFGIGYGQKVETIAAAAKVIGVTQARVKFYEAHALRKIRGHWPEFKQKFWPDED